MRTTKERVLLVDDNPDITTVLKTGLHTHGINVDAFNDPKQVIANYTSGRYGCCVIDIRMPEMSGFELARWIWKREPEANVCFLSAFEIYKPEAEKMFPSLKTFCFVKKPITPSELATHNRSHFVYAK